MNFKVLIIGLLAVVGFSGCIGGDRLPGNWETLHVAKVDNEFCFYVDDFWGIDNYYIYRIETTGDVWKFNVNTIYDKKENKDKIDLNKSKLIKLSSIAGEENCIPYGTNLSSDSAYKAKNLDFNKSFWINIHSCKEPYISEESDIIFENSLYFKYDKNTDKTNIRVSR